MQFGSAQFGDCVLVAFLADAKRRDMSIAEQMGVYTALNTLCELF